MAESADGDRQALDQMLGAVYTELHRIASRYLSHERPGHTLQPTALVHEAYLRLAGQRNAPGSRAQLLGLAAGMMRRILVNHARDRAAAKRGGGAERVSLSLADLAAGPRPDDVDTIALHEALQRLEQMDPRKGRVVELKYFGGLANDEVAELLGVSGATVEREWKFARAWLYDQLEGGTTT